MKALRADCLRNPASGTVEIEYCKRRARGSEWKRLRVRDGASSTPGGIVRTLIEVTAAARKHKSSESLWVYFHIGRFFERMNDPEWILDAWAESHRIVDDAGQPLRILLSRLRKTHAPGMRRHGSSLRGRAHPEVAARHYADLPSLRHLHEQPLPTGSTTRSPLRLNRAS